MTNPAFSREESKQYVMQQESQVMSKNIIETKIALAKEKGLNFFEIEEEESSQDCNNIVQVFSKHYQVTCHSEQNVVFVVTNPVYTPPRVQKPLDQETRNKIAKIYKHRGLPWHKHSEESLQLLRVLESLNLNVEELEEEAMVMFINQLLEVNEEPAICLDNHTFEAIRRLEGLLGYFKDLLQVYSTLTELKTQEIEFLALIENTTEAATILIMEDKFSSHMY
jgi:hypothetical protein